MRQLTRYFGSYTLAKYEKDTGKSVMDLIDIGNFEINKIAQIIKLGNRDFKSDEDAYNRLDEYLRADESNSLISAYFDLIAELDTDIRILKACGVSIEDLKAEFNKKATKLGEKMADRLKEDEDAEGKTEDVGSEETT